MRTHEAKEDDKGTLHRVAPGLYRSSASGVYFAHVRIKGKLFRRSLGTTEREVANRKLVDFRRKYSQVDVKNSRFTVGELCDRYRQTLSRLSSSTIRSKRGILERLREDLGSVRLSALKPSDCEVWISRQAERGLGSSFLNSYMTVLRDALQLAVRDRIIAENPAAHLTYAKRETPIRLTPSFEEFRAIVESIRSQPFNDIAEECADFVELIGLAGLGQAEASSLTWGDVDFSRGTITTFRHKTRKGFQIPIFPQLLPLLERLHGGIPHPPNERVLQVKDAKRSISAACQRLGLPRYSHRSFRRMHITRAIENGVDVKVIAEWQGHRDGGRLILSTYSHVNPAHSRKMAQLMVEPETMQEDAEVAA